MNIIKYGYVGFLVAVCLGGCKGESDSNFDNIYSEAQVIKNQIAADSSGKKLIGGDELNSTTEKVKCYYDTDMRMMDTNKLVGIPEEFHRMWIKLTDDGGFQVLASRGDRGVLFEENMKGYEQWKRRVSGTEFMPYLGKSLIDNFYKPSSPLDIDIGKNSVIAFHLMPESWVFDTSEGSMRFKVNETSDYYDPNEKKYAPYHVEVGSEIAVDQRLKTTFVRFFPKTKRTITGTGDAVDAGGENCYFKYDLPLIVRSDVLPDGKYARQTEVIIDPILTNTGGPITP